MKILAIFLVSILFLSCAAQQKRTTSSETAAAAAVSAVSEVRLVIRELPTDDPDGRNRLVLVGTTVSPVNFKIPPGEIKALEFDSPNSPLEDAVEPKFLLSINKYGVKKIYSFTLPVKNGKDGLPPVLVDIDGIIDRQSKGSTRSKATLLVKLFKNTVTRKLLRAWRSWGGEKERARSDQGLVLLQTIRDVIVKNDPNVIGPIFAKKELEELEMVLRTRFDPNGEYWTFNRTQEDRVEQGEVLRLKEEDYLNLNADQLIEMVNSKKGWELFFRDQKGQFATLAWNCARPFDESIRKYIKDDDNYEAFETLVNAKCQELDSPDIDPSNAQAKQTLIPIQDLFLNDPKGPVVLIDYTDPTPEWKDKAGLVSQVINLPFKVAGLPFRAISVGIAQKDGSLFQSPEEARIDVNKSQHRAFVQLLAKMQTGLGKPIGRVRIAVDPVYFNTAITLQLLANIKDKHGTNIFQEAQLDEIEKYLKVPSYESQFHAFDLITKYMGLASLGAYALTAPRDIVENRWGKFVMWVHAGVTPKGGSPIRLAEIAEELDKAKMRRDKKEEKFKREEEEKQKRQASSTSQKRPVVLLFVDSLRPDRLAHAVKEGLVPNLKELFFDNGVELQSFNTLSNSIASWGTIMSGNDPDQTTIRGNVVHSRGFYTIDDDKNSANIKYVVQESDLAPSSKLNKNPEIKKADIKVNKSDILSYIDPRNDREWHYLSNRTHLSVRRMRAFGKKHFTDYLNKGEAAISIAPVHDGQEFPGAQIWDKLSATLLSQDDGTFNGAGTYDQANLQSVIRLLEMDKDKGKKRLSMNYFAGLDHEGHTNPSLVEHAFKLLDEKIGLLREVTKKHITFKNAVWFLVSDHGVTGGYEYPKSVESPHHYIKRPIMEDATEKFLLNNTQFKVHGFFAGDHDDYPNYRFVVGSHSPHGKDPQTKFYQKAIWAPKSWTYAGERKNKGRGPFKDNRTILVAQSGNAVSPVLMLDDPNHPTRRSSYYHLTHYKNPETPTTLNIPNDLMNLSVDAHESIKDTSNGGDGRVVKELKKYNNLRPNGVFSMGLQGDNARLSAEKIAGALPGESNDEPVLVYNSDNRAGLILTKWGSDNLPRYRYVVVKNFDQKEDGTLVGESTYNPKYDPLEYKGINGYTYDSYEPYRWLTDIQWVTVLQEEWQPTAVSTLPKIFHISPELKGHPRVKELESEIPDFLIASGYGFDYNTNQDHVGDHGGYTYDQVRTTFFVNDGEGAGGLYVKGHPVFTRDVLPTVLDYLGIDTPIPGGRGKSVRTRLIKACRENKISCVKLAE